MFVQIDRVPNSRCFPRCYASESSMDTVNTRKNYSCRIGYKRGNLLFRSLFYVHLPVLYIVTYLFLFFGVK